MIAPRTYPAGFLVLMYVCSVASVMSHSFATPWTVAQQAPPSMGYSRQEYCIGLPFPPPSDFLDPGIEQVFPSLQEDSLPLSQQGSWKQNKKFKKKKQQQKKNWFVTRKGKKESKRLEEKDVLFIVNPLEYLTQNRPSIFIWLLIYLFTHITKHSCSY